MTPSLFPPPPPHNGTRTSRMAADAARDKAPNCRDRVLDAIASAGADGMTCAEVSAATRICVDTVKPRVHELGLASRVVALRETRPTPNGAQALVFVTPANVRGRALEPWPVRRENWRERALRAEQRVRELEAQG